MRRYKSAVRAQSPISVVHRIAARGACGGLWCEDGCLPRQHRLRIRAGRREISRDRVRSVPKYAGCGKGTHPPAHPGREPVAVPHLARLYGRRWKETCANLPATMFHVKHRAQGSTFCEQRRWRGGLFRLPQALGDVSRETRPRRSTLHAAAQPIESGPLPAEG